MKKTFRLENLDCANCAAKMESSIRKLSGVSDAKVNFLTQKLTLEAEDGAFDEALRKAFDICRRIEPDCRIVTGK